MKSPIRNTLACGKRVSRCLPPSSLVKKFTKKTTLVANPEVVFLTTYFLADFLSTNQEHPDVLPHPSQTKHEPAIRILVPQVMQSGASEDCPLIFS